MQKNLYDYSTLIWSPQGKLYQVEYAMEAVNLGNCLLGIRSNDYVILCGLKSKSHETLSYYQEKLFKVSQHIAIGVAGLTPDGRLLHKYMKNECMNYKYVYNSNYPVAKLATRLAEKHQIKTQRGESKRPYGVGLLIAGYDVDGPKLFRTCPSGNLYEYYCTAIGARSQTANTYLENHLDSFATMDLDEMIKHAIGAMKKAHNDIEINAHNIAISITGKDLDAQILSANDLGRYFEADNKMEVA